jgi:hypothetical protein
MPRRSLLAVLSALSIASVALVATPAAAYEVTRTTVCHEDSGASAEVRYTVDPTGDVTYTGFRTKHTAHETGLSNLYVQSSATNSYAYAIFTQPTGTTAAAGQWTAWTTLSYNSPRSTAGVEVLVRKPIGLYGLVLCNTQSSWSPLDADSDGVPSDIEGDAGTNPALADTDGGGATDGAELNAGTDPLSAADDVDLLFPNASSTGPTGTLTAYTGPCTITTPNTVIENALIVYSDPGCPAVIVQAAGVVIRNTEIRNRIDVESGSLTVEDVLIDGRTLGWDDAMLRGDNITVTSTEIMGGRHSMIAGSNTVVTDSWFHDQDDPPLGVDFHENGLLSLGATNLVVTGSRIECNAAFEPIGGGGCTSHLTLLPEFAPFTTVLISGNYFPGDSANVGWCVRGGGDTSKPYAGQNTGVVWTGNLFGRGASNKCGSFGPVTDISGGTGSSWTANAYVGGGVVE